MGRGPDTEAADVTAGRVHFVVGMSLCGITPLSRCLNLHPDVAVFGESRFFGRCYVEPRSAAGYDAAQLRRILRVLRQFRWRATVGDEPGCLNVSLSQFRRLVEDAFSRAEAPIAPGVLFTMLAERVAAAEGKRYAFEKTPHHLNWVNRIVRHLPSSRFVVFLCEPYAFARFHHDQDPLYHPLATALLWRGYMRSYERAARRYPDRIVVVDAAELARDGAAALDRVQQFFGLDLHDLSAPIAEFSSEFATYAHEADPADLFWINLFCGRLMRRRGYARTWAPLAPRPLLASALSFPRWCFRALPRFKGTSGSVPSYLLHWLRQ
jgi:hypothetical protein